MENQKPDFMNIRVGRNTSDALRALGKKGQTYDDIIWALIVYWNDNGKPNDPKDKETIKALRG